MLRHLVLCRVVSWGEAGFASLVAVDSDLWTPPTSLATLCSTQVLTTSHFVSYVQTRVRLRLRQDKTDTHPLTHSLTHSLTQQQLNLFSFSFLFTSKSDKAPNLNHPELAGQNGHQTGNLLVSHHQPKSDTAHLIHMQP